MNIQNVNERCVNYEILYFLVGANLSVKNKNIAFKRLVTKINVLTQLSRLFYTLISHNNVRLY